ncbi:signal transduction histidine kinase [Breznakibacter xylanolyticus]|uniref:histidine kinase n=1 Tax=Breznakibacter xylanolyticus TaxID=990 RepID=A0A2W7N8R9_9BACT|nr:HAMP domain-containing sensor histidine kinase [Breznakibacter xylanolyticus]PZX16430.1 signal transduction histidine kinase [Breznakibacter xylanolyticus]
MKNRIYTTNLKARFQDYLVQISLKNLTLIMGLTIAVLCFYLYSDWFIRMNQWAAVARLVPLLLSLVLLVVNVSFPIRYARFKMGLYLGLYMAVQMMMYAICLIHLHTDALAPSVSGALLVVFLVSLDAKLKFNLSLAIYALPLLVFGILLFVVGRPSPSEWVVLADILPIVMIGFVINRIQYSLRFRLFVANALLKQEQEKTRSLYAETLRINKRLEQKAIEAHQIKEEIELKNRELNKSNATKDRFLGIIAHDLRNPIGSIWGLSDLLVADRNLNHEQRRKCVETINECVKHTHGLLDNLLTWARAQNKAIVYMPAWHLAYECVEGELMVLRQMARKKQIVVENHVPYDFRVFADRNMFETIIRNLVANAIKYTHANGKIELTARNVIHECGECAEIAVTDNGIGMAHETVVALFKIAHNATVKGTANEQGTGLGLLLCKEFIDMHGGVILVDSKPKKGSAFRCLFPMN